jgi:V/A-type H+/Na+-transporting ATPase subunit E
MEALEKGKSKLGEICEILRKETLEPAQNDAQEIINAAKEEAQKIKKRANADAKQILEGAHAEVEQKRRLFENSMDLASKQSFEQLRQKVEDHFFSIELQELAANILKENELVAKLIAAIVNTVEKEGLGTNLAIGISKTIKAEDISKYLMADLVGKLKNGELPVESVGKGAVVKLIDAKMTIDISEDSLKELMGGFLRDSFRQILFKNV